MMTRPTDRQFTQMLFVQTALSFMDDTELKDLVREHHFSVQSFRNDLLILLDSHQLEDDLNAVEFFAVFDSMSGHQKSQLMSKMKTRHIRLLHEILQQHQDSVTHHEFPSSPESVADLVPMHPEDQQDILDDIDLVDFDPIQEPSESGSEPTTPRGATIPDPAERTPPNAPRRDTARIASGLRPEVPSLHFDVHVFH